MSVPVIRFSVKIKCRHSCFKFDGLASDGKRVVMRDCGYFDANECVLNQNFEDGSAIGTICHCKEPDCNGATRTTAAATVISALATMLPFLRV